MNGSNGSQHHAEGSFGFTLNGAPVRVEGVSPNTTLLDFLRSRDGCRGTKEGCAEGDCGACSVALVERDAHGRPVYRAINSCLALLPMVAGREVVTVEGVKRHAPPHVHGTNGHHDHAPDPTEGLHPVQRGMVERFGSQCGYCTPGFIVNMFEAYGRDDLRERWQISDALCGNLCRCTGYRPIADAMADALCRRGPLPAPPTAAGGDAPTLDYAAGAQRFLQPATLDELLALRARHPGATLIAGATELGLEVNKKFYRFETLISVAAVPELQRVARTAGGWTLGAAASLTRVEEALRADGPASPLALANAALLKIIGLFASRPIRNRATLGGNLVNASPIGDTAPVLMALGATVVMRSAADGERIVPMDEFFTAYRRTALRPGEVLCEVRIPTPAVVPAAGRVLMDAFKVSRRREMDISVVSGAFCVELDGGGRVGAARLAYGGVAATVVRARRTEGALLGQPWTRRTLDGALGVLAEELAPINDVRASAEYRRGLVTGLLEKFYDLDGAPEFSPDRRPLAPPPAMPPTQPAPHESAVSHVTGAARYVDDARPPQGTLEVWPVCAPHAHARIVRRDAAAARAMPGVHAVLLAEDVPGENDVGAVRKDEVLLADKLISFHGQLVALVIGESRDACRLAADAVKVEYEPLPPVLTIPEAIAGGNFPHRAPPHRARRRGRRADPGCGPPTPARRWRASFPSAGRSTFTWKARRPGPNPARTARCSSSRPRSTRPRSRPSYRTSCTSRGTRSSCKARAWAAGSAARKRRATPGPRSPRWGRCTPGGPCACGSTATRT